jgi:DNA-binding NtrC family response regulator
MGEQPRVLFVDDEESIRVTLPPMLESYGFAVRSAGTVPEALRLISQEEFNVLIADLNVGSPGDGFTVVSAMRRTQPHAVTFILTGYPAFETALEAIRRQVDDYLIKPTEIESLVETIRSKLADKKPAHRIQAKRLPDIIEQNRDWITKRWLAEIKKDPMINLIQLTDSERQDHVPRLLEEALTGARGRKLTPKDARAAALHGTTRRKQGYTVPLVIRESKLLLRVLAECVQQNLLAIEVSHLIPDIVDVWETIQTELEISAQAFLSEETGESGNNKGHSEAVRPARRKRTHRQTGT